MSEASFDTSAAETAASITSGLSLGQCIKQTAEEFSLPEEKKWPRSTPSFEKEWHTLQGEVITHNTLTDNEMTQLPISDVSSNSLIPDKAKPERGNLKSSDDPVIRLLQQENSIQRTLLPGTFSEQLHSKRHANPPQTAASMTRSYPVLNRSISQGNDSVYNWQFLSPIPCTTISNTSTPTVSSKHNNDPGKTYFDNGALSTQNLSNILEKDDSLAQRVNDLLEGEASKLADSSASAVTSVIPQSTDTRTSQQNYKPMQRKFPKESESLHANNTRMKPFQSQPVVSPGYISDTSDILLKTLSLPTFSESDADRFNDESFVGEALDSLSTSKGTEYGELPDTVDIPHDIVQRLNNIRLLDQGSQNRHHHSSTEVWMEPSAKEIIDADQSNSHIPAHPIQHQQSSNENQHIPATHSLLHDSEGHSISNAIAGGVQLYTGSNPTTPQLPIEEDKLQQLKSYIEKKTGVPQISPLVAVNSSTCNTAKQQDVGVKNYIHTESSSGVNPTVKDIPLKESVTRYRSHQKSNVLGADNTDNSSLFPVSQMERSEHPLSVSSPSMHHAQPENMYIIERSEPEGMSPPVTSLTGTGTLQSNQIITPISNKSKVEGDKHSAKMSDSQHVSNQVSKENVSSDMPEQNLADESLLARVKSVLSDSVSQNQFGSTDAIVQSELSLASSFDSLAAHVKVLLEEEVPRMDSDNVLETSNLSEAIEKFENTDLWKFVSQFLPANDDTTEQPKLSSSKENVLSNCVMDNVSYRKPIQPFTLTAPPHRFPVNDNKLHENRYADLRSTDLPSASNSKLSSQQYSEVDRFASNYAPSFSSTSTTTVTSSISAETLIHVSVSPPATTGLSIKQSQRDQLDPIPGIPDFRKSVVLASKDDSEALETSSLSPDNAEVPYPRAESKTSSTSKANAKKAVTSQPNRRERRNLDTSFTTAKRYEPSPNRKTRTVPVSYKNAEIQTSSDTDFSLMQYNSGSQRYKSTDAQSSHTDSRRTTTSNKPVDSFKSRKELKKSTPKLLSDASLDSTAARRSKKFLSDQAVVRSENLQVPSLLLPGASMDSYLANKRITSSDGDDYYGPGGLNWAYGTHGKDRAGSRSAPSMQSQSTYKQPNDHRSMTLRGRLTSPKRKEVSKPQLPTFYELMETESKRELANQERVELEKQAKRKRESQVKLERESQAKRERKYQAKYSDRKVNEVELDMVPTSDKKSVLRQTDSNRLARKIPYASKTALRRPLDNNTSSNILSDRKERADASKVASIHSTNAFNVGSATSMNVQLDNADSYQGILSTPGTATLTPFESRSCETVDSGSYRHASNNAFGESLKPNKASSKIPHSVSDFECLDGNAQRCVIKRILEWFIKTKSSAARPEMAKTKSEKKRNVPRKGAAHAETFPHDVSVSSTQAVYDSDSTVYYDLPRSRPPTSQSTDDTVQRLFGMDESRAEQVMKRLLRKIEEQKYSDGEKKRSSSKRNPTTSSTPQKYYLPRHAVPEASSIASTDTDGDKDHFIRLYDKRHGHKKKVAYIEESSSSEPIVIKVKKRHRKADVPSEEILLAYDKSIQTVSKAVTNKNVKRVDALDASTNFPSSIKRGKISKKSRAVQTCNFTDDQESGFLNETITIQDEEKENIDANRIVPKEQQRYASFHVSLDQKQNDKKSNFQKKVPVPPSLAWYEPFVQKRAWLPDPPVTREHHELAPLSLQEALENLNPKFVSRSRERQKRIAMHSDERRMQEIWAEERQRVFGVGSANCKKRALSAYRPRSEITLKQAVIEARMRYQHLPEVLKRKEDEARRREYASYRLKAQIYKKKIQNQVLGKYFCDC